MPSIAQFPPTFVLLLSYILHLYMLNSTVYCFIYPRIYLSTFLVVHFFLWTIFTFWICFFFHTKGIIFISCKAHMLATDSFSHYLSWIVFILSLFLKDGFVCMNWLYNFCTLHFHYFCFFVLLPSDLHYI